VSKKKRAGRPRTEERERERRQEKLFEARTKLAALEPGGSPGYPVEVPSASVVEARAESEPCLRCELPMRCVEHGTAESPRGLVRSVSLQCRACGAERTLYLRIVETLLN